ncbi:hypothetical protein JVU11DRAFT_7755 [Chiua virens]|nr:hypothetical protein JVU11DRAFT_7755 [Chiua virens]
MPAIQLVRRHLQLSFHLQSLKRGAAASGNTNGTGHDCVACQDPIYNAEIRAPCGHFYDVSCITRLFQSATRDESLFPPRCCGAQIPLVQVQTHLSDSLVTTFHQKVREFGTRNRVYCCSPRCMHFLGPLCENIFSRKVYACPAPDCGRLTCSKCRKRHSGGRWHFCRPGVEAPDTRAVLALTRDWGWARCPGCSNVVELSTGCFHMTCRCRTEFCYLCQARWKTCQCPRAQHWQQFFYG